jgi:hypothetical protein
MPNLRSLVAPGATQERRLAGRGDRVRAVAAVGLPLRVVLASLVLLGALAPPVVAASGWGGRSDRWGGTGADSARALAPTPSSAVVQSVRVRAWPRWVPAGDGPFPAAAIGPVRPSGAAVAAARPTLLQATPGPVRRRGPPLTTS